MILATTKFLLFQHENVSIKSTNSGTTKMKPSYIWFNILLVLLINLSI